MADFLLDPLTGDLVIEGGMKLVQSPEIEAKQRLEQALAINFGEWFADITAGLPYIKNPKEDLPTNIRYFLGDKFPDTPKFVKDTFDDYIASLSFIRDIESNYSFNNRTREFIYTFSAVLESGESITFAPFTATL